MRQLRVQPRRWTGSALRGLVPAAVLGICVAAAVFAADPAEKAEKKAPPAATDRQERTEVRSTPGDAPSDTPPANDPAAPGTANPPPAPPEPKVGLEINKDGALQGYTLVAPLMSPKTYLIDMQGRVVRTWDAGCNPAAGAYFLENGHLLRPGALPFGEQTIPGPAAGGRIQEFTWDGEVVWDFKYANERQLPHHDITRLPNGNILMIVWDKKTKDEAIAAGRRPDSVNEGFLSDAILEVKPTGKTTGEIVWEWHLWDHLIQDLDKTKAGYGRVAQHPELVDLNFGSQAFGQMMSRKDDADKLRSIGYVGGPPPGPGGGPPGGLTGPNTDWTHINAIAYNEQFDQIMLSVHAFSEIWIIDHGTTTAEAADHKGGHRGKGGDLLYRWGNPRAYRSGTNVDQRLFAQHNAHWIPRGLPRAGHVLIFNNGNQRPDGSYSSVDEIVLPVTADGMYARKPGLAFGPDKADWSYTAPEKSTFFSMLISGAQRLPNGNTLICSGMSGTVFEVTPESEVVWKYVNPVKGSGFPGMPGGFGPGRGGMFTPPPLGTVLAGFFQDALRMEAEQKQKLDALNKESVATIEKLLTEEQRKVALNPQGFDFRQIPRPGEVLSAFMIEKLKLAEEQKTQLEALQKKADETLASILSDDQKKQFEGMRNFGRGGPGGFGPPPGGGRGRGGPPGPGSPPGPGGPPGAGPPGPMMAFGPPPGSSLFRSYRFPREFAGLAGKELTAGKTLEEIEREAAKRPPGPPAPPAAAPAAPAAGAADKTGSDK